MIIILGTAHLASTPGKRSPDGKFREYKFSREVVQELKNKLQSLGYTVFVDIPEDDIKGLNSSQELVRRVKYVNQMCAKYGAGNCLYVSVHVNAAASDGKWHNATGWEAYTTKGKTGSDILATLLYKSAERNLKGKKIRTDYSDGDPDKESNLYVIKNTKCVAVLTENFFQDTKEDVQYLQSQEGKQQIIKTHLEGIIDYIEYKKG